MESPEVLSVSGVGELSAIRIKIINALGLEKVIFEASDPDVFAWSKTTAPK
jgi:phosphosulfolactate synthase (CoM biosynthesis protein A)